MESVQDMGVADKSILNWAGMVECKPQLYFEPEDVTGVRKILAAARVQDKHVRVVGSMHTFNDYLYGDEYVIHMKKMNKILEVNKDQKTVKVEAGITVSDLNKQLENHGLALATQAIESGITIAGAMMTATHGSGKSVQIMAAYVTALDIATASGEVRTLSMGDGNTLNAARVCLGTFGVILNCTIQCMEAFNIKRTNTAVPLDEVLDHLEEIVDRSDYAQVMWFPFTGMCQVSDMYTVDFNTPLSPPSKPPFKVIWGMRLLEFMFWICSLFPFLYKMTAYWYFDNVYGLPHQDVNRAYDTITLSGLLRHYSMEWAVPRSNAVAAIGELRDWVEETGFPVHFPVVIRFSCADQIFLSPNYERNVCHINTLMFRPYGKDISMKKFVEATEKIFMKYQGRPHWGKNFQFNKEYLQKSYPQWNTFCQIRQEFDPNGMFLTKELKHCFH